VGRDAAALVVQDVPPILQAHTSRPTTARVLEIVHPNAPESLGRSPPQLLLVPGCRPTSGGFLAWSRFSAGSARNLVNLQWRFTIRHMIRARW
jgi:hypothetical protein